MTIGWKYGILYKVRCGVEQLAARRAHNPEVIGSNPIPATKDGGVAQLVRAYGSYP